MGKIIVTGGNGFIGSNLIEYLRKQEKFNIICVDTLQSKKRQRLLIPEFLSIEEFLLKCLSYLKEGINKDFVNEIDAIFHLGAMVDTSSKDMKVIDYNLTFSKILFDFCTKSEIPIFYASSAAVYGNSKNFNEDQKNLTPCNLYGESKYFFDKYTLSSKNNKWYGFRFFNVYGPNELHKGKMSSAITQIYTKALINENITLFKSIESDIKDGDQKRDFVHVEDIISTLYNFYINEDKIDSGIYNIGSGFATSFMEIAKIAVDVIGKTHKRLVTISFIETPENIKKGYQSFTKADMNKTRKALNNFKTISYPHDKINKYYEEMNSIDIYILEKFLKNIKWKKE